MIEKTFYYFDPANEPALTVESGEIAVLKTRDAFDNVLVSETQRMENYDPENMDPATGPVYVRGAAPGDVLKVDILDIKVYDQGVTTTAKNFGILRDNIDARIKILPIKDGWIHFKDGWELKANPMIGIIGCTPPERIHAIECGDYGGNLDCKKIAKGATIYLPVYLEGALFACGDLHAVQGDGELTGTGAEVAGEVTVRLTVLKGRGYKLPIVETPDSWYVIATHKDFYEGQLKALTYMQGLLCKAYGFDNTEAFMYLSLQGDYENCQVCQPCPINSVYRIGVPKVPGKPLI